MFILESGEVLGSLPQLAWGKLYQGPAITNLDWNVFSGFPMDDGNAILSQNRGGQAMYDNVEQMLTHHHIANDLNCGFWFGAFSSILLAINCCFKN